MKIISAKQQIIDVDRVHDQSISIDLNDNFVVLNHNNDELCMSLQNFKKFTEMMYAAIQEADKEMLNAEKTNTDDKKANT